MSANHILDFGGTIVAYSFIQVEQNTTAGFAVGSHMSDCHKQTNMAAVMVLLPTSRRYAYSTPIQLYLLGIRHVAAQPASAQLRGHAEVGWRLNRDSQNPATLPKILVARELPLKCQPFGWLSSAL